MLPAQARPTVAWACLPVTALELVRVGSKDVLLVGQGSSLKCYLLEEGGSSLKSTTRLFESEAISALFTLGAPNRDGEQLCVELVALAGQLAVPVRLGCVTTINGDHRFDTSITSGSPCNLGDWPLYGSLLPKCQDLPYCGIIITAQNALVTLRWDLSSTPNACALVPSTIAQGPRSILYSAHLVLSRGNQVIAAAGTVFGEIIVWSVELKSQKRRLTSLVHGVLTGHTGSVFGVCISEELNLWGATNRVIASCSDDRTIRLWRIDLTKHRVAQSGLLLSSTGFGTDEAPADQELLGPTWAHLSRIWNVKFLSLETEGNRHVLSLLSIGEDATCQYWMLQVPSGPETKAKLSWKFGDRHHSGKNIWSSATCTAGSSSLIASGGADGRAILRRHNSKASTNRLNACFQIVLADVRQLLYEDGLGSKGAALKDYRLVGNHLLLATTKTGCLLQGVMRQEQRSVEWRQLYKSPVPQPILLSSPSNMHLLFVNSGNKIMAVQSSQDQPISLIASSNGLLTFMYTAWALVSAPGSFETCLLIQERSSRNHQLLWTKTHSSRSTTSATTLELPDAFQATCALYHPGTRSLVLGSRSGALAVYDNIDDRTSTAAAELCIRHVHGSETVTCILDLTKNCHSSAKTDSQHLLTCGRDGTCSVHRLRLSKENSGHPILETVHSASPPFGPYVEGAYLTDPSDTNKLGELVLYGFHSTSFVVWNEAQQLEVFSVECGGSHRSWAYEPYVDDHGAITSTSGGTFVWTKAGSVNLFSKPVIDHRIIQKGGHGREIKALAKHSDFGSRYLQPSGPTTLIATGAEDTTIRLFLVRDPVLDTTGGDYPDEIRCIGVIKGHVTGPQHLEFSPCGNYLFSSGGCEELYIWRLFPEVPCVEIGVRLWDALPKENADSDARITDFNIRVSDTQHHKGTVFTVAAAYSNGKVKVIQYVPGATARTGQFDILQNVSIGSFCLTCIHHLTQETSVPCLIYAGTNGHIYISHTLLVPNVNDSKSASPSSQQLKPQIHQNSIKTLRSIPLTLTDHLVITGGDDNAIAFSILTTPLLAEPQTPPLLTEPRIPPFPTEQRPSHPATTPTIQVLRVPSAHAAAVTAVSVLRRTCSKSHCTVDLASTGNDQRVKIWRVTLDLRHSLKLRSTDDVQVDILQEMWTDVADAAEMEVLGEKSADVGHQGQPSETEYRLLVVGVGMEVLAFRI